MKLVKQSFEIIEQQPGLTGMKKHIELAGRTCYKSTDKITDDSCDGFVGRMVESKHYAMLEHGTVYLAIPKTGNISIHQVNLFRENPYSRVHYDSPVCGTAYITTNYRVIVENHWEWALDFMCEPTKYHEKRYTVKLITNRQVSHEFVRHRVFSFAQESTRYCNYTKDKFGGISCIIPTWVKFLRYEGELKGMLRDSREVFVIGDNSIDLKELYKEKTDEEKVSIECEMIFYNELISMSARYQILVSSGMKAQDAAAILPNALKTELIMTGFESDWQHFFDLRALGTTGAPHPQAKEIAMPVYEEFVRRGYIKNNETNMKKSE